MLGSHPQKSQFIVVVIHFLVTELLPFWSPAFQYLKGYSIVLSLHQNLFIKA